MNKRGLGGKGIAGILIALAVLALVSQSMANDLLSAGEKEWLDRHNEIRVGVFNDYPPFGFVDASDQAQGMSIDFWKLMAGKLGIQVKFYPTAFAQQLEGLKGGRFDSLAGIFPLEERKAFFDFTSEYTIVATRVYVRLENIGLKKIEDLRNLKVGGVEGDSGKAVAEKAGLTVKGFASYLSAVRAFGRGEIDAIVMDELVVNYCTAENELQDKIKTIGQPVEQGKMTLPVAKGNAVLLGILNKGIGMVSPEEWLKIRQKWIRE